MVRISLERLKRRRSLGIVIIVAGALLVILGIALSSVYESDPYNELPGGGLYYHGNYPYHAQGILSIIVGVALVLAGLILVITAVIKLKARSANPDSGTEEEEYKPGLLGRFSQPRLIKDLEEHLRQNGYTAKVIDKKGPEAIHHTMPLAGNDPLSFGRMGVVKVEGHNLEYVEVIRWLLGSARSRGPVPQVRYLYVYTMRAEVGTLVREIEANTFYYQPSGPAQDVRTSTWQGGWLARILSADGELASMLQKAGSPSLVIRANPKDNYVAIVKDSSTSVSTYGPIVKYGEWDFASPEELALYDRIFQKVKESMRDWRTGLAPDALGSDGKPLSSKKVAKMSGLDWFVTGVLLLLLFSFSSLIFTLWVGIPLTIIAAAGLLYYQRK